MRLLIVLILCISFRISQSQVVNPKSWYVGYQSSERDTLKPDTGWILKQFGSTILNFRFNPYEVNRQPYTLSNGFTFIFDKSDSLILYSNGSKIFNGKHRLVEGGDSLSYGSDWVTSPMARNYFGEYLISAIPNPMLIIPDIKNLSQYYVISVFVTKDTLPHYKLVYSLVDMSLNNGNGKVIQKESVIKYGNFAPAIGACKHGNGRDWWIITREYGKKNFTVILLDSNGLKIHSENQLSGWDLATGQYVRNAMNKFSFDGNLFASFTELGTEVFNFDRCNGKLTNRKEIIIPVNDTFPTAGGGCFSPNNKILYTGNGQYFYQVELSNLRIRKIATYDNFQDTPAGQTGGIPTNFGVLQPAYDGKIYMSTTETTRYLHTIENPNDTGILCNFKQHSVKLLTFNSGLPHYPNYELGAVADKCGVSSIGENELEKIEVFPNPAFSHISLSGISVVKPIHYRIYNIIGQEIKQGETTNEVDLSSLSNGHYFITLSDDRFRLVTKRIEVRR